MFRLYVDGSASGAEDVSVRKLRAGAIELGLVVGVLSIALVATALAATAAPKPGHAPPKPAIALSVVGIRGKVDLSTFRLAQFSSSTIQTANMTMATMNGFRLRIYLLVKHKILNVSVESFPFADTLIRAKVVGNQITFAMPQMEPKANVTVLLTWGLPKAKLGRVCPGYAVASAPGFKTERLAFPCFTLTL
jgi:hypothetical protein